MIITQSVFAANQDMLTRLKQTDQKLEIEPNGDSKIKLEKNFQVKQNVQKLIFFFLSFIDWGRMERITEFLLFLLLCLLCASLISLSDRLGMYAQ